MYIQKISSLNILIKQSIVFFFIFHLVFSGHEFYIRIENGPNAVLNVIFSCLPGFGIDNAQILGEFDHM